MNKPIWFTDLWEYKAGWEPPHLRKSPLSIHSSWGNPNPNWSYIAVGPNTDPILFNKFGVPIYNRCYWCKADAVYYVERISTFTDGVYYDHACDFHADGWRVK